MPSRFPRGQALREPEGEQGPLGAGVCGSEVAARGVRAGSRGAGGGARGRVTSQGPRGAFPGPRLPRWFPRGSWPRASLRGRRRWSSREPGFLGCPRPSLAGEAGRESAGSGVARGLGVQRWSGEGRVGRAGRGRRRRRLRGPVATPGGAGAPRPLPAPRPPGPSCGNGRLLTHSHLRWGASLPGTEGGSPGNPLRPPRPPQQGRLSSLGGDQSRGHRPWTECGARGLSGRRAPGSRGSGFPSLPVGAPARFPAHPQSGPSVMFLSSPLPLKTKHFLKKDKKPKHFKSKGS